MNYYLAQSLRQLTNEINNLWPNGPKWPTVSVGDGWIGDPSHQARKSDHNPDYSSGGVVRAVDIGIQGRDGQRILDAVIGNPRVAYVIHKGRIYSRTYGFKNNPYNGSNPHTHHIHVSIRHDRNSETDTRKWLKKLPSLRPLGISLSRTRAQFIAARDGKRVQKLVGVKRIQRRLNRKYKAGLKVDGLVGKSTLNAWGRHEKLTRGVGGPRIPDRYSLAALCKGSIYRMVK